MMDYNFYNETFRQAITELSKEKLEQNGLKLSVEIVLDSVALKIYKPEWSSDIHSPLDAVGRIFFSIWVNDTTLQEGRIYYNIHALKLKELKRYRIPGRKFADDFRNEFMKYQKGWPNVNIKYGPLTLMQGWMEWKTDTLQKNIDELVQDFIKISPVIDMVLEKYTK